MIHFIVSFCYVMAGAAAVFLLPYFGDWVRSDLAVVGAVIAVLAAGNVHFYIAQTGRVRRAQNGLEWLQADMVELARETTALVRAIETLSNRLDEAEAAHDRRIAQTIDEVRVLHELIEEFVENQRRREQRARVAAMARAKDGAGRPLTAAAERSTALKPRERGPEPVGPRVGFPVAAPDRRPPDRKS